MEEEFAILKQCDYRCDLCLTYRKNVKDLPPSDHLLVMQPGDMRNYKVRLTGIEQVDNELISWIQQAFECA